jgi:cytochrome oxidase Cu insertion factor (SCO1/SenC/PrrC family)/mono/diheme cytochrome c family protein
MQRHGMLAMVLAAIAAIAVPDLGKANSGPWGEGYIPNREVKTQDGKTVRFYDDLIKGKIVIISFIYTSCTDICPLTTARLTQLEDQLGDAVGRDVFMISMTVDPKRDTPERMKEFSAAFHTGPGWTFVTGDADDIRAINYKFGERSEILSEHRNQIVLGNDATGEWQRDSAFSDLNRLVMTVRSLDPKWRDQVRLPAADATSKTGFAMSTQPGQALFKKICAPCHTIGVGDRVGPDLRGVTSRRDRAWLAAFIQNPAKLRALRDPAAMALVEKFPAGPDAGPGPGRAGCAGPGVLPGVGGIAAPRSRSTGSGATHRPSASRSCAPPLRSQQGVCHHECHQQRRCCHTSKQTFEGHTPEAAAGQAG